MTDFTRKEGRRVLVLLALLAFLPVAVRLPSRDEPANYQALFTVNDACAQEGSCVYEPGSLCLGGDPKEVIDHHRIIF